MLKTNKPSEKRRNARTRIHEAAMRTFADRGTANVSLSDLAEAAGIARGTIYNNISNPENLFADVAADLSTEMIARVEATIVDIEDPALRLATGIRLFIRRAAEERDWGLFLVRFGIGHDDLQMLLEAPPVRDARLVLRRGGRAVDSEFERSFVGMLAGSTLAAMSTVIGGHQTWRNAGIYTAELALLAAGMSQQDAQHLSRARLPDLAEVPLPAKHTPRSKSS
jgi:AcrR family transcriptional regulator